MIDRFNFYDIYGYLLPGILLFSLVWIPLGVLTGMWPPAEWSSAILALALAYVIGHILHALSEAALPYEFRDMTEEKNKRAPSDLLLDNNKQVLINSFSGLPDFAEQIKRDFGETDIKPGGPWTKELGDLRTGVFFRCRNALIRQEAAGYAEQQQGMYALMRGAAAAFLLSCVLYGGMGLGLWIFPFDPWFQNILLLLLGALFLLMTVAAIRSGRLQSKRYRGSKEKEKAARCVLFWLVGAAFFCSGLAISKPVGELMTKTAPLPPTLSQLVETDPIKYREREQAMDQLHLVRQIRSHATGIVSGWSAASALLALICFVAFRSFAVNFALTVYRDYANVHLVPSPTKRAVPVALIGNEGPAGKAIRADERKDDPLENG